MTRIAVVVLDTLRKDAFDDHFEWLPGTRFDNAWSTTHYTTAAHASLFTGLYGSEAGVHKHSMNLDCERPVLAEQLHESGYTTRAFSANPNVSPAFDFDRGFDEFTGSWRVRSMDDAMFDWENFIALHSDDGVVRFPKAVAACVNSDCATLPSLKFGARMKMRDWGVGRTMQDDGAREARSFVRSLSPDDEEFFFLNLIEPHVPYDPPEPYKSVDVTLEGLSAYFDGLESDPDDIRRAYDDSVRYLADMYEDIFSELRSKFDLVITLSDHGEMLGERDVWEHPFGVYPPLTHVPMVVWRAEDPRADEQRTELVNLFDVYATVCAAAGIEADAGRDLRTEFSDDAEYLTEFHGVKVAKRERLRQQGHGDVEFLADELVGILAEEYYGYEDFGDEFVERGDGPYRGEEARERLDTLREGRAIREDAESVDDDIDATTQRHLEDLGYL